ncbi:MAG: glucosamine-6-phosphate deaminase [Verrucomicrobiales bacterium]|nr:glucosamine-6-phosphate deaminase [Verrucomicrobiales bacterium]
MSILNSPGKQQTQKELYEKTRSVIVKDSTTGCSQLAAEVAALIRERQAQGENVVLGLATGSTPVPFYKELIRLHQEEGLSFKNVITFNLDEYHGLAPDHRESYNRFMREQLFDHIDLPKENINIPDGTVSLDAVYESCLDYEKRIEEAGGIDLQILGIGRTGHIGFNEPGSSRDSRTRMITLDRITRRDAAADFLGEANVPRHAITMGVGTILAAKRLVLMAWGGNKAEIVQQAVEGKVTDRISASFLQEHSNATFLVDDAASSQLTRVHLPWLVGSVKWDGKMIKRAVTWLSHRFEKPVLRLVDGDYNESGAGEILTASGRAYDVNISVFDMVKHTITGWPGGKPGTDDSHRPERAEPASKRVLIFSPEPSDAIMSLGGTIHRLIEQGHQVKLVVQTSGGLRVPDLAARKFAAILQEMAGLLGDGGSSAGGEYASQVLKQLEDKGAFGDDTLDIKRLKALILRGEVRDAAQVCGLAADTVVFQDLPFYEKGRYRQFQMQQEDVDSTAALLQEYQPNQIYATGHLADPSALQTLCYRTIEQALEGFKDEAWVKDCRLWLYRGKESELNSYEIDMAVPMSPEQLDLKGEAIRKFQSISQEELDSSGRNQTTAKRYDQLGMAEYEAIESFERG